MFVLTKNKMVNMGNVNSIKINNEKQSLTFRQANNSTRLFQRTPDDVATKYFDNIMVHYNEDKEKFVDDTNRILNDMIGDIIVSKKKDFSNEIVITNNVSVVRYDDLNHKIVFNFNTTFINKEGLDVCVFVTWGYNSVAEYEKDLEMVQIKLLGN